MTDQNQDLSAAFASAQPSIPPSEINWLNKVLMETYELVESTPHKDHNWAHGYITDPRIHQSGDEGLRIWAVRIARHAVKDSVNLLLFGAFLEDHKADPSVKVRRQVAWAARESIIQYDPDLAVRIANALKDDQDPTICYDVGKVFQDIASAHVGKVSRDVDRASRDIKPICRRGFSGWPGCLFP